MTEHAPGRAAERGAYDCLTTRSAPSDPQPVHSSLQRQLPISALHGTSSFSVLAISVPSWHRCQVGTPVPTSQTSPAASTRAVPRPCPKGHTPYTPLGAPETPPLTPIFPHFHTTALLLTFNNSHSIWNPSFRCSTALSSLLRICSRFS